MYKYCTNLFIVEPIIVTKWRIETFISSGSGSTHNGKNPSNITETQQKQKFLQYYQNVK